MPNRILPPEEQSEWLVCHIPHRVRAAIAHSDLSGSILDVKTSIHPPQETLQQKINWHCAADSIWEGRLAATRWLIEFVGIKTKHVSIVHFDGGTPCQDSERERLTDVWERCSQASAHPTRKNNRSRLDDKELVNALKIVLRHLQSTIYSHAGLRLRDWVLLP